MNTTQTPSLAHLVGAYFHQDWFEFYPDEDAAIDAFIAESGDLVAALPGEIDRVLAMFPGVKELEAYLDSQRCDYIPPEGADAYRDWLRHIADRVRAETT